MAGMLLIRFMSAVLALRGNPRLSIPERVKCAYNVVYRFVSVKCLIVPPIMSTFTQRVESVLL